MINNVPLFTISFKWTRVLISAIAVVDFFGWIDRFANLSKINELIPFEEGMLDLIRNIKFKDTAKSCFQRKLDADIKNKIKKPDSLLIPADKTTNYYAMNTTAYNKLIKENVTKTYKKSDSKVAEKLNAQSARIAVHLNLDDRIEKLAEKEAFITLKDHKPTFNDHPTCRLINPSKSEIGVISKQILDDINTAIINKTQINQWKNTSSVLKWFNGLQHKETLSFICFDVCDFYPSITEEVNNCNCRNKNSCPLEGNCKERNIIYQAEVTTPQSKETYIGLCDTTFKERYRNHTCSFRNERYKNATELSKYIWGLKDRKINYEIRWRKIRQARSYSNINKKCNLCLCEKYFIICKPEMSTLNQRNELTSICRHSKKFLLNTVLA